ncbi:hypothetical protein BJX99DRAFT_250927 [Aspergillus californicus]
MSPKSTKYSTNLLSLLLFQSATTQSVPSEIIGCNDLSCPLDGSYDCHLADRTYSNVGLARIPDPPSPLEGLTLLKGVHVSGGTANNTAEDDEVSYHSAFYLGFPESLSVDDFSGCAVMFNEFTGEFDGNDKRSAVGSCPDVIEEACIGALTSRAQEIFDGTRSGDICGILGRELQQQNTTLTECRHFAGQDAGLGNFTVASLSDLLPIAGAQNASSDCWPVLPKSDGLVFSGEDVRVNTFTGDASLSELFKITPVLTVFPSNGDGDSSAQLTCLKAVEVIESDEDEDGNEEAGDDAGALFSVNMVSLMLGALVSIGFAMV